MPTVTKLFRVPWCWLVDSMKALREEGGLHSICPPFQGSGLLCLPSPRLPLLIFHSFLYLFVLSLIFSSWNSWTVYSHQWWEHLVFFLSKDTCSSRMSRTCLLVWSDVDSDPLLRTFHHSLACVLQPLSACEPLTILPVPQLKCRLLNHSKLTLPATIARGCV